MPRLVSLTCPNLQILGKTQTVVFPVSVFLIISLKNKNSHNSRTSKDIDVKLGLVTKRDERNTTTSKYFDEDIVSANYDVIVVFPFYGWFGVIRNPDSKRIVYNFYVFLIRAFHLTKTEDRTKKSVTQLWYYFFK